MAQGRGGAAISIVAVLALLNVAAAVDHIVGDETGWTIPTDASFYSTWAAKQTFAPGDNLVFNYPGGLHDVQVVSSSEYSACASTSGKIFTSGADSIPLPKAGNYFFICTIPGHCQQDMKLEVTVKGAAATAPATPPTPAPKATPPPTPPPKSTPPPTTPPVVSPPPVESPPPVKSPPPKATPPPAVPPVVVSPPPKATRPPVEAPVSTPPSKAPTSPPVGAPTPPPVGAPGPEVSPSSPVPAAEPTPSVLPGGPAPGPGIPQSSAQSVRVCLGFVVAAVVATFGALLV